MAIETQLSVNWEGTLSDEESRAIADNLRSVPQGTAELHTENALSGLELLINTILIAMATKAGEKIVEAALFVIALLRNVGAAKNLKTVTLNVTWDNGQTKIDLPLDDEEKLKRRLLALGELISNS